MDGDLTSADKQNLISSFLEIAVGQTADTARQFLQTTSWKLDEAIQLFYLGNESGVVTSPSPLENIPHDRISGGSKDFENESFKPDGEYEVRAPIPVKREVLYDNMHGSRGRYSSHESHSVVPFRNFDEEMKHPGIWGSNEGATSTTDSSRDNLASLYRPPFALMYHGPFEKAKDAAKSQNKWLLVNVQSTCEFSSHMLNRDTWANEAVAQTIGTNFIFWQVYDDTEEGRKVCTYYRLDSIPVILVIDPITGQKIRLWRGMIQPESLLEDLLPLMDRSPSDHVTLSHKRPRESSLTSHSNTQEAASSAANILHGEEDEELLQALAASMENKNDFHSVVSENTDQDKGEKKAAAEEIPQQPKKHYPPLQEEPKGNDRNLICRVGVRLPDGRRIQRNFLRSDPIQLLWSHCLSQLKEEGEGETRPFRLAHAIPGASKYLDYDSILTFEESGLANSMISVTWE